MQYERQRYDECKLATLAMLAGVSLDQVRDVALAATDCKDWRQAMSEGKYWAGVGAVVRHFGGIEGHLDRITLGVLTSGGPETGRGCGPHRRLTVGELTEEHFRGRGEMVIRRLLPENDVVYDSDLGEMVIRRKDGLHSVAYENGVVYDPEQGFTPCAWEDYFHGVSSVVGAAVEFVIL